MKSLTKASGVAPEIQNLPMTTAGDEEIVDFVFPSQLRCLR
jgi:hypothetical protein